MARRAQRLDRSVRAPDGVAVDLTVARSGVVNWNADLGGTSDTGVEVLLAPLLWLGNLLVHWLVFRGGWTLFVRTDAKKVAVMRYGTYVDAQARLESLAARVASHGLPAALDAHSRSHQRGG